MKEYDCRITGIVLRELRLQKGLTQEVLSGLAGLARSHLAMIECGTKNPSMDTLWRIADVLGLRLSEIIRMIEEYQEKADLQE